MGDKLCQHNINNLFHVNIKSDINVNAIQSQMLQFVIRKVLQCNNLKAKTLLLVTNDTDIIITPNKLETESQMATSVLDNEKWLLPKIGVQV